ncbi:MAG TPA: PAS domain-containing protein [Vicinamibacterales bacterium]
MSATKPPLTSPPAASETRDWLLARVAFEAIWERDLRSDIVTWDRSLEPIFGYRRDEVVNHVSWWRTRVHPEDVERVERVVSQAIRSGAPDWMTEYRFRRNDGSWAWVASRGAVERDAAGQAVRVVGAMIDITPLKDTESRLRLFTEQIPARACVTDRDLRVVWDAGAAFPDSPTAVGKTVPGLFAESPDRDRVLEGCRRALAGESTSLEIDDGASAAQLQLVPFRDPAGEVIGLVGIAFDITDRLRSEERVRAGQRLLQQVLETLPVGVIVIDREGDVLLRNPPSASIWGKTIVSGEERWATSKGFWHTSGEAIAADEWASRRALDDGQTSRDELIDIETFDGESKIIKNYAAPLRDAEGAITGAVVVNEDVTEGVRAEESLRKTEKLLVAAEALGRTGSWEQDLVSGRIFNTDANRRLFFGDDPSKGARMEDYLDVLHPDDVERVKEARQRLDAGTGSGDIEYRVVWPDGSVHWIFGRATVVRDQNGGALRVYGTNADITERKLAQEELARRAEQLETLSARLMQSQDEERRRIARELHDTTAQNLAALRMNLSRLERAQAVVSDPELRDSVVESLTLANAAITEIRTLSYLLHPPMIDEAGVAPSLRWFARGFQERTGIAVAVDIAEDLDPLPQAVKTAACRIVQEGLTNVQRHSGSKVARIAVTRGPNALRIDIEDEGRGLPYDLRDDPSVFARGVGLASMRERARELGGTIDVHSGDTGTIISVSMPLPQK